MPSKPSNERSPATHRATWPANSCKSRCLMYDTERVLSPKNRQREPCSTRAPLAFWSITTCQPTKPASESAASKKRFATCTDTLTVAEEEPEEISERTISSSLSRVERSNEIPHCSRNTCMRRSLACFVRDRCKPCQRSCLTQVSA